MWQVTKPIKSEFLFSFFFCNSSHWRYNWIMRTNSLVQKVHRSFLFVLIFGIFFACLVSNAHLNNNLRKCLRIIHHFIWHREVFNVSAQRNDFLLKISHSFYFFSDTVNHIDVSYVGARNMNDTVVSALLARKLLGLCTEMFRM